MANTLTIFAYNEPPLFRTEILCKPNQAMLCNTVRKFDDIQSFKQDLEKNLAPLPLHGPF